MSMRQNEETLYGTEYSTEDAPTWPSPTALSAEPSASSSLAPPASTRGAWMKPTGIVLAVAGTATLGAGLFFGSRAISKNDEAVSHCKGSVELEDGDLRARGALLLRGGGGRLAVTRLAFANEIERCLLDLLELLVRLDRPIELQVAARDEQPEFGLGTSAFDWSRMASASS